MKKIYAKQCDPESYDYNLYFDEGTAVNDLLWLGGNRDFCSINSELFDDVANKLDDLRTDLYHDTLEYDEVLSKEELRRNVENYFSHCGVNETDRIPLTDEEVSILIDYAVKYGMADSQEEKDLIRETLAVIYQKPFKSGIIRGSCQGDWLEYICPEELSNDYIKWVEAVLFATGSEWQICDYPLDSADELDAADTFCDYTEKWRDDDIKSWVLQSAGYPNDGSVEVRLLKITGQHHYIKYDYAEV